MWKLKGGEVVGIIHAEDIRLGGILILPSYRGAKTRLVHAILALAITMTVSGGCEQPPPPELQLMLLYTADTFAYTQLCGCCGGQMGGLARRAHYLTSVQHMISNGASASGLDDPAAEQAADDAVNEIGTEETGAGEAQQKDGDAAQEGEPIRIRSPRKDEPSPEFIPDDFILVDCGNFSDPATEETYIQSVYTCRTLELMCYDAVNLGKRETHMSQERLVEMLEPFQQTPVISANVRFTRPEQGVDYRGRLSGIVKPFARLEIAGHRFFITGVTTAGKLKQGLDEELGILLADPAAALAEVLNKAREDEYAVVLVNDLDEREAAGVRALEAVDCLVGVDHSAALAAAAPSEKPVPTILPKGKDRGRELGRADLQLVASHAVELLWSGMKQLRRGEDEHPLIVGLLAEMEQAINDTQRDRQLELARQDQALTVDYMGSEGCATCHPEEAELYGETRHASAFSSLLDKEEGRNGMCLPCHTTGYGESSGYALVRGAQSLINVSCEACHGPGEVHIQMVQQIELTGPREGLNEAGLHEVTEATCRQCHIETTSPDFDYADKLRLIDHSSLHG